MTIRLGPRPAPPPPPDWLVADADRFTAAVEAAWAEAEAAAGWYMPDTAALELFISQDVAMACPVHMRKLSGWTAPPRSVVAYWRRMVTPV